LRLPQRTRGLLLGTVTLVAGPLVALTLVSSPAPAPAHPTPISSFTTADNVVHETVPRMVRMAPPPSPTATPAPAPRVHPVRTQQSQVAAPSVSYPAGSVEAIIEAAAAKWGVSGSWMISIARCESGLRPNAYNPSGPYYGLFQFLMSTFTHNGGTNIWDPTDQANVAAEMLAHGQAHQWSCA
jgi:soluble lytic murein transglycosylase-like protein